MVRTVVDSAIEGRSKYDKRIKTLSQAAEKTASDRFSPFSEHVSKDIFDDVTNEKTWPATGSIK